MVGMRHKKFKTIVAMTASLSIIDGSPFKTVSNAPPGSESELRPKFKLESTEPPPEDDVT